MAVGITVGSFHVSVLEALIGGLRRGYNESHRDQ